MYYRDDLPINFDEYLRLFNIVYSDIIMKIIDEYMNAVREEYKSLVAEKEALEIAYKKIAPNQAELNEIMLSKGIKVDFYHLIENYEVVPFCIVFNDMIRFPIKDKYRSKVQMWEFELNPIKMIEKLVLIKELMHMEDYETSLLRQAIEEEKDALMIKEEISKIEYQIDDYCKKYLNNHYNINISIMKDVVRKLYDSGIITDEFLSSISSKNKTSVRAKLTQLVEFLSENIYHIDYYISKRNNDNEDLNHRKLALVNKKMLPDWYPPTRIVD